MGNLEHVILTSKQLSLCKFARSAGHFHFSILDEHVVVTRDTCCSCSALWYLQVLEMQVGAQS